MAKTLQRRFRTSKREIQRTTNLLRLTSRTIADELVLVEPGAFDDLQHRAQPRVTRTDSFAALQAAATALLSSSPE